MENQTLITSQKMSLINKKVRICIECGSALTQKKVQGICCKECGNFFKIREDRNWVKIPAGAYADIMMQILPLEIQTSRFLENIATHAIWI